MYLYFNEKGILKEIINDEALRVGNNDLNHIYIYWENAPEVDSMWVKFKLPSGETTLELTYPHAKVKKVIPYDKQRDLKYFKDYVTYEFFDIAIPDGVNEDGEAVGLNVLAEDGLVSATVRFVLTMGQSISTLGLITFNVEKSVIQADLGIKESQFDYLLKHMLLNTTDTIVYKVDDINSLDLNKVPVKSFYATVVGSQTKPYIEFHYVNEDRVLLNASALIYKNFGSLDTFPSSRQFYYGTFNYPNNSAGIPVGNYIGWRDTSDEYYFLVKGKLYITDKNLSKAKVSVMQDTETGVTQLINLLVDENMQVKGTIYKGMGTPTENEEVLTRGEINSEIVPPIKTYIDTEITTLRDESMNYTDDMVDGAIAGLKDESGKIRSDLLPSYVDDVLEFNTYGDFPIMGETGKIYLDTSTNDTYRWSGTQYFHLNVKGVEELERVTPTDIVAVGNTIKLYHDSNEITGQENPVTFKTINGEPIIGNGDIEVSGGSILAYNYDISPATAVVGTLTSDVVTALSDTNATITRAGELYRYSDKSDSEYLTYIHASIDTSQADKPAVMRAIRINLTTYAWELLDYDLAMKDKLDNFELTINDIKNNLLRLETVNAELQQYNLSYTAGKPYNSQFHLKIEVQEGEQYVVSGWCEKPIAPCAFVLNEEGKGFYKWFDIEDTTYVQQLITIPSGAKHLIVNGGVGGASVTNKNILPFISKVKNGVTIESDNIGVFFGDSIVEGFGALVTQNSSYGDNTIPPFQDGVSIVADALKAKVYNGGIGSSSYGMPNNNGSLVQIVNAILSKDFTAIDSAIELLISQNKATTSMRTQWAEIKTLDFSKVDFIALGFGTNDWTSGRTLDNEENALDTTTILGALRYSVSTLMTTYPQLRIYVFTPFYRFELGSNLEDSDTYRNPTSNLLLTEICEGIVNCCEELKIPCLNMYKEVGFNKYNKEHLYFDYVHPNRQGYKIVGSKWAKFILSH